MQKAIIFGAGSAGQSMFARMKDSYEIVGFWDNDKNKQGGSLFGLPISPPRKDNVDFDIVIIGSFAGYENIRSQLLNELHIPPEKIYEDPVMACRYQARLAALKNASSLIYNNRLVGNVAELGVFQGLFAREINKLFPDRKLYLFDTFEGFDSRDLLYEDKSYAVKNELNITNTQLVLNTMPYKDMCIIKEGWFPDTALNVKDSFIFVSLDADLYQPTLEGLKFFYPQLVKNGYIFVHDYYSERFDGVKKAVDEYLQQQDLHIAPLGDDCSVIIVK